MYGCCTAVRGPAPHGVGLAKGIPKECTATVNGVLPVCLGLLVDLARMGGVNPIWNRRCSSLLRPDVGRDHPLDACEKFKIIGVRDSAEL